MPDMDVQSFYAQLAPYYDHFYNFNAPGGKTDQEVSFLQWALGEHQPPEVRILDVACGTGRHLLELHRRGYRQAEGCDLSPDMIGLAHSKLESEGFPMPLFEADMQSLPVEKGPYDAVTMWLTAIGHMVTNAELFATLKSLYAMLRPGGLLVLETINYFWIMDHFMPQEDTWIPTDEGYIHRHITRRLDTVKATILHSEFILVARHDRQEHRHYAAELRGLSWPELEGYLSQHGFCDITLYPEATARTPATSVAPRLLITARRPE